MKKTLFILPLISAVVVGCAGTPKNSLVQEAESRYNQAQSDPQVAKHARGELHDAGEAVNNAKQALEKKEDKEVVNHLAYVAQQRIAIAQATAERKSAEEELDKIATERAQIQLDVRTAEAEAAKQRAQQAESQLQAAETQLQSQSQAAEQAQRERALTSEQLQEAQAKLQQMQSELQDLNAKQTNRGMVITLTDVLFDVNKADLKPGAQRSLDKLAQFLKEYPERTVSIEGFTDSTGSDQHNKQLSEQRAQAVRDALAGMGVTPDRIVVRGYGEEYPVANNDSAAGRQLNRRVEIVLSDEQGHVTARAPEGKSGSQGTQESSTASGGQTPAPAMGGTRSQDSESTGVKKSQ